jgi:hypothetical protein
MEASKNRVLPNHPFLDGNFYYKKSILGYTPIMETTIYNYEE